MWDRNHIYDDWPEDEELKNIIVVHGHTPVPYINNSFFPYDKPYWYCNNHKIDIDYWSVVTGVCALLNLDTLEQEIFYTKPYYPN